LLLAASVAEALTIQPTYVNAVGETWTAERVGVIERAVLEWEQFILEDRTVEIDFSFANGGDSYLGRWAGSGSAPKGTDIYPWTSGVEHDIAFNADKFDTTPYLWWDPSPTTSSDRQWDQWDALSVARHEIAHALGFGDGFWWDDSGRPWQSDRWMQQIDASGVFDAGGLNVQMYGDNSHVDPNGEHGNDLMTPALVNGVRRNISSVNVEMLSLAHGYQTTWLGDLDASGTQTIDDLQPFLLAIADEGAFADLWPEVAPEILGDMNRDGGISVDDIQPFLAALAGDGTVPEPAALLVLAGGATLLVKRRRSAAN
jgi:hypothetical protein